MRRIILFFHRLFTRIRRKSSGVTIQSSDQPESFFDMFKKSPTEQAMSDINAIIKLSQNIEAKAKEACSQTVSLISSLGKAKNKLVETIPQNYQIILDIFLGELEGREFEDNIDYS